MFLWLTARMNCLCTCCKRKHRPRGVHYQGSCCFPSSPNRIDGPGQKGGVACLAGQLGSGWCPGLPVVLELCFSAAVRAAHKYGSQETRNEGGRVLLSHHSYIIRRTACLWWCVDCPPRKRWVHLFWWILKMKINAAKWCTDVTVSLLS